MKYILSIDQGTTSTRAILFDDKGRKIAISKKEFTQITPQSGWVLHDPIEIINTVYEVIKDVLTLKNLTLDDIDSIGIANQRETTVMWDKKTGIPIYNAIVWQSRQSVEICNKMAIYKDLIYEKTGLLINPYFSASKIKWILEHKNCLDDAKKGNILFGTIDTWIIWNLTKLHITDHTNASRTLLYNIKNLSWDDELLSIFEIPKAILPEVRSSSEIYGNVEIEGIKGRTVISSLIGDQQASLFGQCCFDYGDLKCTYGTGCFLLMNTKNNIVYSNNGLLTTIAYSFKNHVEYAVEGSVFVGGAAIQWLRDGLKIISSAEETEKLAFMSKSDDIYFVPAFVGLATPYWDNDVRGTIFGITRQTTKNDIVKATLEAICFEVRDVMEVMKDEARTDIKNVLVDGGAAMNNYILQFQADLLNKVIRRPILFETTALGAAYLAGLATGYYKNLDEIRNNHMIDRDFIPQNNLEKRYMKWKDAVSKARLFK